MHDRVIMRWNNLHEMEQPAWDGTTCMKWNNLHEMEQPAWDGTTCKISSKLTFTISSPGTFARETKTSGIFAFCCRHFKRPTKLTLLGEKMNIFKEAQSLNPWLNLHTHPAETYTLYMQAGFVWHQGTI